MAEKGVWLSIQPFLDDEDATPFPPDSVNRAKQLQVVLLVDGNPLENIILIEDPARNFLVIMKDGTIFKNLLQARR
jgi:hypothetical protein